MHECEFTGVYPGIQYFCTVCLAGRGQHLSTLCFALQGLHCLTQIIRNFPVLRYIQLCRSEPGPLPCGTNSQFVFKMCLLLLKVICWEGCGKPWAVECQVLCQIDSCRFHTRALTLLIAWSISQNINSLLLQLLVGGCTRVDGTILA